MTTTAGDRRIRFVTSQDRLRPDTWQPGGRKKGECVRLVWVRSVAGRLILRNEMATEVTSRSGVKYC